MTPRRAVVSLTIAVALFLGPSGPAPAEVPKRAMQALQMQAVPVEIESPDVVETQSVAPDGTVGEAGHLGISLPCTPGVQPFVRQLDPQGTEDWLLTANADRDCDGDGQGDGGGGPMFADWPFFSEAYIMAGTTKDSLIHPSGDWIYVGHILLAWMEGDDLVSAWGLFLMRISQSGVRVGEAYFGAVPEGTPADTTTCEALCDALSESTQDQYLSTSLEHFQGWVVAAGSHRASSPDDGGDKDVFLARLSDDLTTVEWVSTPRSAGDDQINALALDSDGTIFAAGDYGVGQDAFAARFDPADGRATHVFRVQGPLADEGYGIAVSQSNGTSQVDFFGSFYDQALFGGHLYTGFGVTHFIAHLTLELVLLSVDLPGGTQSATASPKTRLGRLAGTKTTALGGGASGGGGSGGGSGGGGSSGEPVSEDSVPEDVVIVVGQQGNCDDTRPNEDENCVSQVAQSDNEYLKVIGEPQGEDDGLVEIDLQFSLSADFPKLTKVSIELTSESCMTINLALGGGNALPGQFIPLPDTVQLCPIEEPTVTFEVPPAIAQQLGLVFSAKWTIGLHGEPCPAFFFCAGSGEEVSVNVSTATSEFGDP